jgi:hypothetical protein
VLAPRVDAAGRLALSHSGPRGFQSQRRCRMGPALPNVDGTGGALNDW